VALALAALSPACAPLGSVAAGAAAAAGAGVAGAAGACAEVASELKADSSKASHSERVPASIDQENRGGVFMGL
jgi:hypothetical protein